MAAVVFAEAGCQGVLLVDDRETQPAIAEGFRQKLLHLGTRYSACVRANRCPAVEPSQQGGDARSDGLGIASWIYDRLPSFDPCAVLRPLRGIERPYVFVGVSGLGGAVAAVSGGVDVVWDLAHLQAAAFAYGGGGLASLAGVSASAYEGFGVDLSGQKQDVLVAWVGRFAQATLSVHLPVIEIGVGGAGFMSEDGAIVGAAVGASAGWNWIPTPADGSVTLSHWAPFDGATRALGQSYWLPSFKAVTTEADGGPHVYLQFKSGVDTALSLLERLGPMASLAAAQAIALETLRETGVTIDSLCPPTQARPPQVLPDRPGPPRSRSEVTMRQERRVREEVGMRQGRHRPRTGRARVTVEFQ
jgi:hypothetical protein